MSFGMILLTALTVLILCGVLQRVLDRMALTDRQALFCVGAILIGGWLPDLQFGMVTLNLGGALIPLLVCAYLFFSAGTGKERARCLIASGLTAALIYMISVFFPADPTAMPFDPMLLYGVAGGAIAWILGRSRRSAFIAGITGVIVCDVIAGLANWQNGIAQAIHLGSAGALDAAVLSGISAVLFCELFGEMLERITKARIRREMSIYRGGNRA